MQPLQGCFCFVVCLPGRPFRPTLRYLTELRWGSFAGGFVSLQTARLEAARVEGEGFFFGCGRCPRLHFPRGLGANALFGLACSPGLTGGYTLRVCWFLSLCSLTRLLRGRNRGYTLRVGLQRALCASLHSRGLKALATFFGLWFVGAQGAPWGMGGPYLKIRHWVEQRYALSYRIPTYESWLLKPGGKDADLYS